MTALFLAPVYLLFCLHLWRRLNRWLKLCPGGCGVRIAAGVLFAWACLSILPASFLEPSGFQRFLKQCSSLWLGVLLYTALVTAAAELLWAVGKHRAKVHGRPPYTDRQRILTGGLCLLLICALSVGGTLNAKHIQTTDYRLTIPKSAGALESLKIILVADLHLGYSVGTAQMEQMVEKINREEADLVVIAGDIFDNSYAALDDPARLAAILGSIQSKYGVYACYGNHDVEEKLLAGFSFSRDEEKVSDPRMDALLEAAQIRLLRDEGVLIDDAFYLLGRADYARPGRGIETRKTPAELTQGLDHTKPILVLDHEPKELQALADAGVDLDLCGHTHDGQLFPGNLLIRLFWENPCGYLQKDGMHNVVTSGVGVFGPNMRVGTKSELCRITVVFQGGA